MRKLLYALTIVGLVSFGTYAQQSGGAFIPSFAYDISGAWNFSGTIPTLTGNGSVVGTTATQTLTNKTLTSPSITGASLTTPNIGVATGTSLALSATTNQIATGASSNITTLSFPASSGAVTLTFPNTADTMVGRATTDTLTNKTLTSPTITGATMTTASLGKGSTRVSYRQDFDGPCRVFELADHTAELVTDGSVNGAYCDGGIGVFEFRIDGDQASPFIVTGGALDIDNNGTDDEGVEIVVSDRAASTNGWVEVGTSVAKFVRANITITSVSGTDNFYFGWAIAGAHVDNLVLGTIDTYGVFLINDAAGNIQIVTGADGTDAADEATTNPTWADAETITLEVRVSTSGVFTFYMDDVLQTVTLASGAADAGDILQPIIGLLNAADADTELKVNWIEIGQVI